MNGVLSFRPPWIAQPYSVVGRGATAPTVETPAMLRMVPEALPALISCTAAESWAEPQAAS